MKHLFYMVFVFVFLSGCQAMTAVNMEPLPKQQRFYSDGAVAVASPKKNSIAMIAASSTETPNGQRLQLALRVQNVGKEPFDIDTSDISVSAPQTDPLKVYSYDELVKEEKQRRNTALILAAISGVANAYSASQAGTVYTSGTYQSTTNSPYGGYQTTGAYTGTYYDPARAQVASDIAAARTSNQIDNIAANSDARLNSMRDTILKRTTVFPGYGHGGVFTFDTPRLNKGDVREYDIAVSIAGEVHNFRLIQKYN